MRSLSTLDPLTRRASIAGALAVALMPAAARRGAAQTALPAPEVLASFPTGTFLENLEPQPDGSVLFTSYLDKKILRWSPAGVSPFATLAAHPVALLTTTAGIRVTAHAAPFTSGADFVKTMTIVELGPDGKTRSSSSMSDARFLNGMIALDDQRALIADSLAGVIWSYRHTDATLVPWLADDSLKPVASKPGEFALGANGIKIAKGHVYFSNSSTTTLFRVALEGGAPKGPVQRVATLPGIDDFAIHEDGRIFIATHRADVVMLAPGGKTTVLIDQKAEGATAVALGLGPSSGRLFVTTTGGLFAGLKADANLLSIPIPK